MSYESIEAAIEDYESQLCACEDRLSRLQAENERRRIDLEEAYKLNAELALEYKAENEKLKAQLRWIPVAEGPKKNERYLVVQVFADIGREPPFFAVRRIVEYDLRNGWAGNNAQTITHWMPTPPLPKEAKDEA